MHTFISLLRGINVSGQKSIRMADLRTLYEALNLTNVETYLQSGNVIFDSEADDPLALARAIEEQIARNFGYEVSVLIRDSADFERILDNNPFLTGRSEDIARLYVTFLAALPAAAVLDSLSDPAGSGDEFRIAGQEVYLFCPGGYGKTKLSNTFFERKLKVPATTRNWKTVTALAATVTARGR